MSEREMKLAIGKILYEAGIYPNIKGYCFFERIDISKSTNTTTKLQKFIK